MNHRCRDKIPVSTEKDLPWFQTSRVNRKPQGIHENANGCEKSCQYRIGKKVTNIRQSNASLKTKKTIDPSVRQRKEYDVEVDPNTRSVADLPATRHQTPDNAIEVTNNAPKVPRKMAESFCRFSSVKDASTSAAMCAKNGAKKRSDVG